MTARRLDPSRMPDWPRHMTRDLAAAYVGAPRRSVLPDDEVQAGKWPKAQARGAKGGLATWDRVLLDAASDREAGLSGSGQPAAPFATSAEVEADFRERLRRAKAEGGRPKTRQSQAA